MIVKFHETKNEQRVTLEQVKEILNNYSSSRRKFMEHMLDHTNHFTFYDEEGNEISTHASVTISWDWKRK